MFDKSLVRTLQFTLGLTFLVIVLGAYTRLKDAGLGCPDWPGCYGHLLAPSVSNSFTIEAVNKAWIEMIHRYIAGTLGLCIFYITIKSILAHKRLPTLWRFGVALSLLVIFQALLGMWTVTLRLNPLVVMGHLLGGIAILCLLYWIYLNYSNLPNIKVKPIIKYLTSFCVMLLCIQIALGGWTSANYSALVCADFPTCQGHWWPTFDWHNAFGTPTLALENGARVTIQMTHRIGALVVSIVLISLAFVLYTQRNKLLKALSISLLLLLMLQLTLGISNILAGLPVFVSLAHTICAVVLLLLLLTILYVIHGKKCNI